MSDGGILVIDDNPTMVTLLGGVLREAGYHVRAALEGTRALSLAAAHPPEMVLLDLRMPGIDGFEVCRRLKSDEKTSAIPVIVISAMDDVEEKIRAFEAGAADYVTKPFEPREVLSRVGAHIQLYRLRRELEAKQAQLEKSRQELAEQNAELKKKNDELIQAEQRTRHVFSALAAALPGTVLDGKYRLDQKIGAGGFATVFRAEHLELKRAVAVKVFRPWEGNDTPEALERFRREGVAACRVQHPNAVSVTDFGISSSGIAYLVMELLRGVTVADLLKSEGRLSLERCVSILVPVCHVLGAVHAAHFVHRDIKPENIFLHRTPGGETVKVLDFGIAKLIQREGGADAALTRGGVPGTVGYVAPERLLGQGDDEKSDVYSVGVVFYLMLSGREPFPPQFDGDFYGALRRPGRTGPPPLEIPGLPPAVDELLEKALARDPAQRPTAEELASELLQLGT
ncbi:MAG: Serine/threonine-protein kinase PknD [Thermoanaerobaculia bacterium]|nr:Serine/threonine-protein kinase PknD [Thermoanaerobaculia bacterium]